VTRPIPTEETAMATRKSGNPFAEFDVTRMLGDMQLPGVDMEAMMQAQRRNIEALSRANQLAGEGMHAVLRRQAEILRQSMEEANRHIASMMEPGGTEQRMARQAEIAKEAFEAALANMREIADLMAKSNQETFEVINKRVSESLDEVRSLLAKAEAGKKK